MKITYHGTLMLSGMVDIEVMGTDIKVTFTEGATPKMYPVILALNPPPTADTKTITDLATHVGLILLRHFTDAVTNTVKEDGMAIHSLPDANDIPNKA